MHGLRQFGGALLIALTSAAIVIGSISLSLAEGEGSLFAIGSLTATNIPSGTPQIVTSTLTQPPLITSATATLEIPANVFTATLIPSPSQTPSLTFPTQTRTLIACGPPAGWVRNHTVQSGDNLFQIALAYFTTTAALQKANCLGSSTIIRVGDRLWVPNIATRTPTFTIFYTSPTPYPTDPLTDTPLPFTQTPTTPSPP